MLLFATACASVPAAPAPVAPSPTLGVVLATPAPDPLDVDREAIPAQPPLEARQLLAATNELDRTRPRVDHERVIEALRALDTVLETLTPDQPLELQRLREATHHLDRSAPDARTHAAFVRTGLEAAWRALDAAHPARAEDLSRYRVEVAAVRDEVMKLSTELPLLEQYAQVRIAFEAVTRAVFAAEGAAEPTFEEAPTTASR